DACRAGAGSDRVDDLAALLVIIGFVMVPAPFGDVAVHVKQAERIGLFRADRMRLAAGVTGVPGVIVDEGFLVVAEGPVGAGAAAAGVFPFGLGRQPVAG